MQATDYAATIATPRQAAAIVRDEADALIDQLTRRAKGYDRGAWRDDCRTIDRLPHNTIAAQMRESVAVAFALARRFA